MRNLRIIKAQNGLRFLILKSASEAARRNVNAVMNCSLVEAILW